MSSDNHFVSSDILNTSYATSRFPDDGEVQKLGISPSQVHRIHNGPETPLSELYAQVDVAFDAILAREKAPSPGPDPDKHKPAS